MSNALLSSEMVRKFRLLRVVATILLSSAKSGLKSTAHYDKIIIAAAQ